VEVIIKNLSEEKRDFLTAASPVVKNLARVGELETGGREPPRESATSPLSEGELFVPLAGLVDFKTEVSRLDKEIARIEKEIQRYEKKLSRKDFLERAPKEVVAKDRRILRESIERRDYLSGSRKKVLSWLPEE
jgi:valyl-tRNA synthetase